MSTHFNNAPTVGAQINAVEVTVEGFAPRGYRASKLIHRPVYNDKKEEIGNVNDVVITGAGEAALAVVGVGGFLGIDEKLVAVPADAFEIEGDNHVVLPKATQDTLKAMPTFKWAN